MDSEWFFEQFYASHYVPLALFREGKQEQMISSLDKLWMSTGKPPWQWNRLSRPRVNP